MYGRILVAADSNPVSDRALEEATKLADLSGGKLHVIIIADSPLRHLPDYAVYYNPEPLCETTLKVADGALAKAREKVEASNVEGVTFDHVCQGRANEEIAERIELKAQASDTDVVIVGTHGRRGVRRLMLGSVAEGLIRMTSRPILLIRDK